MYVDLMPDAIAPRTPEEQALFKATLDYFLMPDEAHFQKLVRNLAFPNPIPDRFSALATHGANLLLDADGQQMTEIIASQGEAVACHEGCDSCCYQFIVCNPFEAALIGLFLKDHPEQLAFFEQAYERWDAATRDTRESYLAWARCYERGKDDGSYAPGEYMIPCVFLDNSHCRAYAVRPYACRSYLSVSKFCGTSAAPNGRPGMWGMDYSAFTPHKKARAQLVRLLWEHCGVIPDKTETRPMPELVLCFLEEGFEATLARACR